MNNSPATRPKNQLAAYTGTLKKLQPVERKMIEAGLMAKINELPPLAVIKSIIASIQTVFTICGQKIESENDLALYAQEFYTQLMERYPRISPEEIQIALKNGVYDEYGKYYGLNVKTFIGFVKAYLFSADRLNAKENFEQRNHQMIAGPIMSPEEKDKDNREFTNYVYDQFLKGKLITDYIPTLVYDFLRKTGKLVLDDTRRSEYIVKSEAYLKRFQTGVKIANDAGANLTSILNGPSDTDITVKNTAKRFAVADFFSDCKNNNCKNIFD